MKKMKKENNDKCLSFLGIDPGKTGCLCEIELDINYQVFQIKFYDWPESDNVLLMARTLLRLKENSNIPMCVIEKVSSMPKQGVVSSFKFGTNFGMWKGMLACAEIPFQELTPVAWRKNLVTKTDGKDQKKAVENVCSRLYPSIINQLYGTRGAYKDGRGDALLMAHKAKLLTLGS